MAVTARPKAATAMASSHGAPRPRIGLVPRSTSAWPEVLSGFEGDVGAATADDVDESLATGTGRTPAEDWLVATGALVVAVALGVRAARLTFAAAVVGLAVGCAAGVVGAADGVGESAAVLGLDGAVTVDPVEVDAEDDPPPGGRELMITLVPLELALAEVLVDADSLVVAVLVAELVAEPESVAVPVADVVAEPVTDVVAEPVSEVVTEVVVVTEPVGRGPCE